MANPERDAVISNWVLGVVIFSAFTVLSGISKALALWLGSMTLAFCLGALWAAGATKRKMASTKSEGDHDV